MADDATDFIHPVIQAMQFARQRADERQQNLLKQQNTEAQQNYLSKELAQRMQEHKDEIGQKQQELDIRQQQEKTALQGHDLDVQKFIQGFLEGGGKATPSQQSQNFIPTVTNPTQPPAYSIGGIPVTQAQIDQYTPEAKFNRDFGPVKAKADYEEGLKETNNAQVAGLARETERQKSQLDFANRMSELQQQGINSLATMDRNKRDQIELENLRGGFQLAAAHIAHQQGNEDMAPTIKDAFDGVINGQTDYSKLPKDIKSGVSQLAGATGFTLPTDRKDYASKLDAVSGIQTLLKQYQDLAVNYSRDGKEGGIQNYLPGLAGKIPFTDLKSQIDAIKTNGGSLASFFDKQNRKSDAEIVRQVGGLFDPNDTVQQNLQKIEEHKPQLNTVVKGTFAGMAPDQVKYILGNRGITDLDPSATPASTAPVDYRKKYGY